MTSTPTHDVAVIVVGLNARRYIESCFDSLAKADWRAYAHEVIYVDNGSSDGTLAMIEEKFPRTRVIANGTNLGFCKAANQGAAIARGRYFFFINDDTIVLDDAIALLIEYMDGHPEVGTAGGRLLYPDMTDQWSGRRFPSPINAILGRRSILTRLFPNASSVTGYLCKKELRAGEPFACDWVSAAAQIVRPEVFNRIGGFAEDYYYWHEAIFCDRIRKAGKRVCLHPRSKIIHFEGKGSGARPHKSRKFHIIDFHRGAYRCYCEHYDLKKYNPLRWLTGLALSARASLLLTCSWLRSFREGS